MKNDYLIVDYELFEKYEKEYFIKNLIIPYFEDEVYLKFLVCKESKLDDLEKRMQKLLKFIEIEKSEVLFLLSNLDKKLTLFKKVKESLNQNSLNEKILEEFFYLLLDLAIEKRASDIHIEAGFNSLIIRFRIDGKLNTFLVLSKEFTPLISSYIKLISNLDITQSRLPQDSRFTLNFKEKKYDFRVSFVPTVLNESIVIRILDNKNVELALEDIGLSSNVLSLIKESLSYTQGLVLVTGPTGSGKTTTLYSMLKYINSNEKKIITVEDPVEYKIESLNQIAVNSKIGLSFDLILKSILRQDPDIIFIGEIRDKFSLDIALQASLTGHLVIASIHANNAVETITRLFDLEADPFLISSTLKLIIAQRLVLSFCKFCEAKGCEKCNYTRYFSRIPICEALKIDEKLSSMIFKKSSINKIKEYLQENGHKTLLDDALLKVSQNLSSKEEVLKVVYS